MAHQEKTYDVKGVLISDCKLLCVRISFEECGPVVLTLPDNLYDILAIVNNHGNLVICSLATSPPIHRNNASINIGGSVNNSVIIGGQHEPLDDDTSFIDLRMPLGMPLKIENSRITGKF